MCSYYKAPLSAICKIILCIHMYIYIYNIQVHREREKPRARERLLLAKRITRARPRNTGAEKNLNIIV